MSSTGVSVSAAAGRGDRLLAGITRRMDQVLGSVTGIVMAAESIAGSGPVLRRDDFAATRPLVAGLLQEHAGLAAGAGVVLAPHTVADAPRCIEWWWADQSARIVPLEVDLDPESADGLGAAAGPAALDAARRSRCMITSLPCHPRAVASPRVRRVIQGRRLIPGSRHDQRHVVPVKSRPAG